MLHTLSIQNIVLIAKLDLELHNGLCALTGETGAGKSIILDALGLILGARANTKLIRHGCSQGSVTACFTLNKDVPELKAALEDLGLMLEEDNQLFIRRVLYSTGKSKAFVNDVPVNQSTLSQLASHLVEIHGQHDQYGIMQSSAHRDALDAYGQLGSLVERTRSTYNLYNEITQRIASLHHAAERAAQEEDYLRHIYGELSSLAPQEGEEEKLSSERAIVMQHEKILSALHEATDHLEGQQASVTHSIQSTQRALAKATNSPVEALDAISTTLDQALEQVDNASQQLHAYIRTIEHSELSIDHIEERLFALREAARKFRRTPDELVPYIQEITEKLELIDNQQHSLGTLEKQCSEARKAYVDAAHALHHARAEVAQQLADKVLAELAPLKMERCEFMVDITTLDEASWSANGSDHVQFIASMNPGMPMGPIHKLASGGELSRFMLALKVVLADTKSLPVLIFDEVDTGIGGAVADAVGKRLAHLAQNHQLLVITHQPQVAARANMHLKVSKTHEKEQTNTHVTVLTESEKNEELARMLAGDIITEEARAAAKKLAEA